MERKTLFTVTIKITPEIVKDMVDVLNYDIELNYGSKTPDFTYDEIIANKPLLEYLSEIYVACINKDVWNIWYHNDDKINWKQFRK